MKSKTEECSTVPAAAGVRGIRQSFTFVVNFTIPRCGCYCTTCLSVSTKLCILDRPLFSYVVLSHPSPMLSMLGVDFFPACRCVGEDEGSGLPSIDAQSWSACESISEEEGGWGDGRMGQASSYRWREGLRGRARGARGSKSDYTFLLFISLSNDRREESPSEVVLLIIRFQPLRQFSRHRHRRVESLRDIAASGERRFPEEAGVPRIDRWRARDRRKI